MKKEDYSIYDYRLQKEIQNHEVVYNERLN